MKAKIFEGFAKSIPWAMLLGGLFFIVTIILYSEFPNALETFRKVTGYITVGGLSIFGIFIIAYCIEECMDKNPYTI